MTVSLLTASPVAVKSVSYVLCSTVNIIGSESLTYATTLMSIYMNTSAKRNVPKPGILSFGS